MGEVIAVLGIIISFAFVFGVVTLLVRMRQRKYELQAEVQTKLIERFGTSQELVEFLQSPSGQQFVNGVQKENVIVRNRALGGIRKAIILSFIGAGLLTISLMSGADWVSWFGVMFVALGVGYLVAAFVSMRLARETDVTENAAPQV